MKLNSISPADGSKHAKTRLGRGIGSGLGKTSGKGHKGQKARKSGLTRKGFEGGQNPLQRRLPKFGFKSRVGLYTTEVRTSSLNNFPGTEVTIDTLKDANIIGNNIKFVKVILNGELTKALNFVGIKVTQGALTQIQNAGGTIKG